MISIWKYLVFDFIFYVFNNMLWVWMKMKFRKIVFFLKIFVIEKFVIYYNIKFYVLMRLINLKKYICKVKFYKLFF